MSRISVRRLYTNRPPNTIDGKFENDFSYSNFTESLLSTYLMICMES